MKFSYVDHVLIENRYGLCVDILVTESTQAERRAARQLITRARTPNPSPISPKIGDRKTPGLSDRTTSNRRLSNQPVQTKTAAEEIFDWLKAVGGLRKMRFTGQAKTADGCVYYGRGI